MKNIENIKTVVFPVAGLGSRFLPATKSVAKELFPILNIPLIEYAVDEAKKSGIEKFIFVISREKLQVARHFETNAKLERELKSKNKKFLEVITKNRIPKNNIFKVFQERPLGLGHAIWCARKYIDGPFAVVLPDDLVFSKTRKSVTSPTTNRFFFLGFSPKNNIYTVLWGRTMSAMSFAGSAATG